MSHRRAHVTDHALLRYLERVEGIDVEAARKVVERIVQTGIDEGASGVLSNGMRYCLKVGAVVTVKPISSLDHRTGGHRGKRGDDGA